MLLEQERGKAENDAEQDRDDAESEEVDERELAEDPPDEDRRQTEQLDHRAEELEDEEVRDGRRAERAVAAVARDAPVAPERLAEAAVPAAALTGELADRLRGLRPADRIGHELDAVPLVPLAQVAVQPDDELDVLADRVAASSRPPSRRASGGRARRRPR